MGEGGPVFSPGTEDVGAQLHLDVLFGAQGSGLAVVLLPLRGWEGLIPRESQLGTRGKHSHGVREP